MNINSFCSAWTRNAANQIPLAATVHSTFLLPIAVNEDSSCRITLTSDRANYFHTVHLFVVDKVLKTSRPALCSIDRCFGDIMTINDTDVEGNVFVFRRDFHQTLPDIPNGMNVSPVDYSVLRSPLWDNISTFNRSCNMRSYPWQEGFSQFLIDMGKQRSTHPFLNYAFCRITSLTKCFQKVSKNDIKNKVIITPRTHSALKLSNDIFLRHPGTK